MNEPKSSSRNKESNFSYRLGAQNFRRLFHKFCWIVAKFIRNKFNVDISVFYRTLKTGSYFQLKSSNATASVFNVVHKFCCLRDADVSYIAMTSRHLVIRAQEHLSFNINKTTRARHISSCQCCKAK